VYRGAEWISFGVSKHFDRGDRKHHRPPLPSVPRKRPSRAKYCHRRSHLVVNAAATRLSRTSSLTRTASTSITTSRPDCHSLQPVVSTTCGSVSRLANFCSSSPVANQTESSTHAATTGVTCGRPSPLTVEIQKSSASSRTFRVSP